MTMTSTGVRCGNHARDERVYHASASEVRACYAGEKVRPASEQVDLFADFVPEPVARPVAQKTVPVAEVSSALQDLIDRMNASTDVPTDVEVETFKAAVQTTSAKPEPGSAALWATIPVGGKGFGYYALRHGEEVHFYRIERKTEGKWKGYTFVTEQGGDTFYPIEPRARAFAILSQIAGDYEAAGMLYASELNKCTRCGRTLTDKDSRARGMGPECRKQER